MNRKELKTDKFAVEVEHSVEYVAAHRKQVIQYGAAALAAIIIVGGIWYYRDRQAEERQQELGKAMDIMQVMVNPTAPPNGADYYPTELAKDQAGEKAFKAFYDKHAGSKEAAIAASYLGAISMDMNKLSDAEKYFQKAAESGDANYSSIGKLSLAQVYLSSNRMADAEKLLRSLYDNPTAFVSKEQATIALVQAISVSKPAEARKLLTPLMSGRPAVSRTAITLMSKLPPQ